MDTTAAIYIVLLLIAISMIFIFIYFIGKDVLFPVEDDYLDTKNFIMSSYQRINICLPKNYSYKEWNMNNIILCKGEVGIESGEKGIGTGLINIKVGDGKTPWKDLPYALEQIDFKYGHKIYKKDRA